MSNEKEVKIFELEKNVRFQFTFFSLNKAGLTFVRSVSLDSVFLIESKFDVSFSNLNENRVGFNMKLRKFFRA